MSKLINQYFFFLLNFHVKEKQILFSPQFCFNVLLSSIFPTYQITTQEGIFSFSLTFLPRMNQTQHVSLIKYDIFKLDIHLQFLKEIKPIQLEKKYTQTEKKYTQTEIPTTQFSRLPKRRVVVGKRGESTLHCRRSHEPKGTASVFDSTQESRLTYLTRQSFALPPRAIRPSTGISKSHPPFRGWIIKLPIIAIKLHCIFIASFHPCTFNCTAWSCLVPYMISTRGNF